MSLVYISRCGNYNRDDVRRAARECLVGLDDAVAQLAGRNILLKPNLLSSSADPGKPVNTHYEVVRAVAEFFIHELGCHVVIGDSCGTVASGATERALQNSGIKDIARELGASAVNFDTCRAESRDLPEGAFQRRIHIAAPVLEAEAIVNLPKFKTHQLTLLTGAIKNMLGVVPGRGKKLVHEAAPKPEAMARALVEIFGMVKPHINLMDAVVGMEGRGPNSGDPKHVGALMASVDAVALDAVAAAIMGYAPGDIKTTEIAAGRGLGTADLSDIDVRGEQLENIKPAEFRKPSGYRRMWLFDLIPDRLAKWVAGQNASYQSVIDHERCTRCGQCVANCPVRRLHPRDGRIVADETPCIACYCCEEVCDFEAITIVRSPFIEKMRAIKRIFKPAREKKCGANGD